MRYFAVGVLELRLILNSSFFFYFQYNHWTSYFLLEFIFFIEIHGTK